MLPRMSIALAMALRRERWSGRREPLAQPADGSQLAVAFGGVAVLAHAALEYVEPLVLLGSQLRPLGRRPSCDGFHEQAERVQAAPATDRLRYCRERLAFGTKRDDALTDAEFFCRRSRRRLGVRAQTGRTLAAFGPFWPASTENSTRWPSVNSR